MLNILYHWYFFDDWGMVYGIVLPTDFGWDFLIDKSGGQLQTTLW